VYLNEVDIIGTCNFCLVLNLLNHKVMYHEKVLNCTISRFQDFITHGHDESKEKSSANLIIDPIRHCDMQNDPKH
jgi:hypothetical protein